MRLNLGALDHHVPGFLNVDIAPPADIIADLRNPWPWEDSTVDAIYAHDVFEHLPNIVHTMNEACRVLKPGGVLDLAVPAVNLEDGRINPGAFCDPTHVSYWHLDVQYYFSKEWNHPGGERGRFGPAYGITAVFNFRTWKLLEYGEGKERRSKLVGILEAVK